jgi:hypothetical protein
VLDAKRRTAFRRDFPKMATPKIPVEQVGLTVHSLDVSQNVYTQSTVESRLGIVKQLEKSLRVM